MYNFDKKTCDKCGSGEDLFLSIDGGVLCGACHKEDQLKDLITFVIPEWERKVIELQDKLAAESKVFAKILESERTDDIWSTNNPKSKTRNAIIIKQLYTTIEDWEEDLLTNIFYKLEK